MPVNSVATEQMARMRASTSIGLVAAEAKSGGAAATIASTPHVANSIPESAAAGSEHHAFDQDCPEQSSARRTDRGANRRLALAHAD